MEIHPYYLSWKKRIFDLIIAIGLLLLASPLLFLIGAGIITTAGLPVIYKQKRAGKNKRVFIIYKFRTMYVGAEKNQWRYRKNNQAPSPMYKNWEDPRFVGIGRWLSKTGLDELPQLFNIIKGNMSLVGPRPLPVYEAEKLNKNWNFRYKVKPGVFSQWSVSANKINSLQDWKRLEKETLKTGGMKYELRIILKTLQILI
jgi:lipopolysaccharide/colanic/teichoic acid biosynthesis glycosyltransferase